MRDKYFAMFVKMKHFEQYYISCQCWGKRVLGVINGFCILIASAGIASWGIWKSIPLVWVILVAISQVINIIKPMLPFTSQLISCKFIIPELSKMLIDIDCEFSKTHEMNNDQISKLIKRFETQYLEIDKRFTSDVYFPQKGLYVREAKKATTDFFYQRYGICEI